MIDEAALQAINGGDLERLRECLDGGADPLARDEHRGYTLLHVAAQEGALEAGRMLLAHGGDPNASDAHGNGPLWTAVYNDRDGSFISLLLEAGADPVHANKAGRTPADLAQTIGGVTAERLAAPSSEKRDEHTDRRHADLGEAQRLWHAYVPARGQASTVQGELIRAVEKLRDEAQRNGNMNWRRDHAMLVGFLSDTLLGSEVFDPTAVAEIERDTQRLLDFEHPETADEPYDRLTARVVEWSRAHPEPIPHEANPELSI